MPEPQKTPETTETDTGSAEQTAPATPAFTMPFDVPTDLATLDRAGLATLAAQIAEHAAAYSSLGEDDLTDEAVAALQAYGELAGQVNAEATRRSERAAAAASSTAALSQLADFTATDAEPEGSAEGTEPDAGDGTEGGAPDADTSTETGNTAVTAANPGSRTPRVRDVAPAARAPQIPATVEKKWAVMRASADVPGFASGASLDDFAQAGRAIDARLGHYPTLTASRAKQTSAAKRPITVYNKDDKRTLTMKNYTRHGAVQFERQFPAELRVINDTDGYRIAEYAANERRLPGGSLVQSAKQRIEGGKSLTAAAAWCAPSEVIYQLCELESMDGILGAPELQTTRGGWQIPQDGGPDFAAIWDGIGNMGDTHLSETEIQNDVLKVCTEIPCPDFEDVRLGVDYVCLTGGLLQRRGYPEIVARFARGAMIALAHKMNQGFIADIVAASGPATVIPFEDNGDDAASALLSGVELAIIDIKYRNRMPFAVSLEVVMPMWFLGPIRAGLARRRGVKALDVTDGEIMDWFAIRNAMPQFVYDWQDFYTGLADGPGGPVPLSAFPTSGQFLVYPAGTWVRAVQDVVSLDTIYDSTNLQTNQYTAIFAEDGWAALQMCPDSRLYEVPLDPSGVVGCCPPNFDVSP